MRPEMRIRAVSFVAVAGGGGVISSAAARAAVAAGSAPPVVFGVARAWQVHNMTTGIASSVSFYVDSGDTATGMSVGLYGDSGGHPGSLLAQGSRASLTKGAWNVIRLTSQRSVAARTYWIAAVGTGGE